MADAAEAIKRLKIQLWCGDAEEILRAVGCPFKDLPGSEGVAVLDGGDNCLLNFEGFQIRVIFEVVDPPLANPQVRWGVAHEVSPGPLSSMPLPATEISIRKVVGGKKALWHATHPRADRLVGAGNTADNALKDLQAQFRRRQK